LKQSDVDGFAMKITMHNMAFRGDWKFRVEV
jgi:hypothetical protein